MPQICVDFELSHTLNGQQSIFIPPTKLEVPNKVKEGAGLFQTYNNQVGP